MQFDEDYISCEPAPYGMVLKSLERRTKETMQRMQTLIQNPYRKPFQKLQLRAIEMDVEA